MPFKFLEHLTEPLNKLLTPPAERLGKWLGSRKPKLYIRFNPASKHWCLAKNGHEEMAHIAFEAEFNHDDDKQAVVLVRAYAEGTEPQLAFMDTLILKPGHIRNEQIGVFVSPFPAPKGQTWTGRIVFEDQFKRKYKTEKATFRWVGPTSIPTPQGASGTGPVIQSSNPTPPA
jgi:hypothetical protein